jgi:hypothetical protein
MVAGQAPREGSGARNVEYRARVIVKFRDDVGLPYDKTASSEIEARGIGPWKKLTEEFEGLTLDPLYASVPAGRISELVGRATSLDPTYRPPNFLTKFAITVAGNANLDTLARALASWPTVEAVYVEPPPSRPPAVNPAANPLSPNQRYLDPAPDGIDAEYAWLFQGGDATGQALVDLEQGWCFNHEDLVNRNIGLISGLNFTEFSHGTAALGEIAAEDNTVGCVGIAPNLASVRCVSQWRDNGAYSTAEPIIDAIAVMQFGDVLLLETQTTFEGHQNVPAEIEPAVFFLIRLATALGIVVVEAAGNGAVDLDSIKLFDRTFRDSGAILVASASSASPHSPMPDTCFGSRVDCYGWGENVVTLKTSLDGTDTTAYTSHFSGTSAAAAIVAGAALAVQGFAQAHLKGRFGPWELRAILRDPAIGTPSQNPPMDRIGVMPNLRAIIDSRSQLERRRGVERFPRRHGQPSRQDRS